MHVINLCIKKFKLKSIFKLTSRWKTIDTIIKTVIFYVARVTNVCTGVTIGNATCCFVSDKHVCNIFSK